MSPSLRNGSMFMPGRSKVAGIYIQSFAELRLLSSTTATCNGDRLKIYSPLDHLRLRIVVPIAPNYSDHHTSDCCPYSPKYSDHIRTIKHWMVNTWLYH